MTASTPQVQPVSYEGKQLCIYTHPELSKGGIFSKTYISLDDKNLLKVRILMIPPEDLWCKKEP